MIRCRSCGVESVEFRGWTFASRPCRRPGQPGLVHDWELAPEKILFRIRTHAGAVLCESASIVEADRYWQERYVAGRDHWWLESSHPKYGWRAVSAAELKARLERAVTERSTA